jgi:endonuclease VIII
VTIRAAQPLADCVPADRSRLTSTAYAGRRPGLPQVRLRLAMPGRIITVEAEDRLAVPKAKSRRLYKQELCYDCGTPIVTGTINRRTAYACPGCQPAWVG